MLKIMAVLRAHTGHDFSNYKQNTIRRRVEHRMAVNRLESLDQYLWFPRQKPAEMDTLFRDLLIGVTGFFRNAAAFDAVQELALPRMLADRVPGMPLRIWVPGCSTGEEAYSLAVLAHEAVEKARVGIYPARIAADVSAERLSRFFSYEDKDSYAVKKTLRDHLIFADQDVIKEPPFSKLHLVSCLNLLIYMEPVLRRRLLSLFHYSLLPGGFLLLGNSESVGGADLCGYRGPEACRGAVPAPERGVGAAGSSPAMTKSIGVSRQHVRILFATLLQRR